MSKDINQIKQEMVGYKYKHYKNGKIYLVLDIVIHTETQELMVVYRNINDEQIWCRPLSIFNEEIDNEHHKRFEKIDDDSEWKSQQEQAIFKEFEELGWEDIKKPNNKIFFERYNQEYDSYDFILIHKETKTYTSNSIDMKTHQLLHRLFEIWGFFDE